MRARLSMRGIWRFERVGGAAPKEGDAEVLLCRGREMCGFIFVVLVCGWCEGRDAPGSLESRRRAAADGFILSDSFPPVRLFLCRWCAECGCSRILEAFVRMENAG